MRTAKEKGNDFEVYLLRRFRETVDVNASKTNRSGAGLNKMDVRIPGLNLEIEAKNANTFNLMRDWDQMKSQITSGNMGVLAMRHPRRPEFAETLIVLDLEDFIAILQGQQAEREVSYTADRDTKWKVQRLIDAAKTVLKTFDVEHR
jgi:hypothetical protein